MSENHFIFCGGIKAEKVDGKVYRLDLGKGPGMIHLETDKIVRKMVRGIDSVMHDFLEIASYVYVGDQYISRGGSRSFDYGNRWHRKLYYHIPVCEYEIWNDPAIKELLSDALSFAAGESYQFEFTKRDKRQRPDYLTFDGTSTDDPNFEKVVMFSGGLDSFSGALEEVLTDKRICLVSHHSNNKPLNLQSELHAYLVDLQKANSGPKPLYIPVEINKDKRMTREKSQRTRSFLFAVLGTIIANYEKLDEVTFFENGVVSCNLPWDGQTLQARATRTTHPKLLESLSMLVSELLEKRFVFINPYFELTKKEVIDRMVNCQQQALIRNTRSCASAIYQNPQTHCGTCSQCIDRRFASLAAQCLEHDPWLIYKTNIFTDAIQTTEDRAMATGFAGFTVQTEGSTKDSFFRKYLSEICEIITCFPDKKAAMESVFSLHQRYANQVNTVLCEKISEYNNDLVMGILPDTCLLQMVAMKKHLKMSLDQYHENDSKTQTMIVEWNDDCPEYIPNADAVKLCEGKISLSLLSKRLTPDGNIRYMRKGQRCKVHVQDFRRFALTLQEEITDEKIDSYLKGVEERKKEIQKQKQK